MSGDWMAADHGPLPGYGWAALAVGGYVLWRRLYPPTPPAPAGKGASQAAYAAGLQQGFGALSSGLGSHSGIGGAAPAASHGASFQAGPGDPHSIPGYSYAATEPFFGLPAGMAAMGTF